MPASVATASKLKPQTRDAVRDLILCLADNKRLLGMRYANWILGAPELEAGIACASMAQDEWGHARLLYSLLKDFGADVERLEHSREPQEYYSMEPLDREPADWAELVALNALADAALTVQLEALRKSSYQPLRQRVDKMLDEERFHAAHGAAWFRRLARSASAARDAIATAMQRYQPPLLRWFGPDSPAARSLVKAGVADAAGDDLRERYVERVRGLLEVFGGDVAAIGKVGKLDFTDFDEHRRRGPGCPDEETVRKLRGDKNRAFLMD